MWEGRLVPLEIASLMTRWLHMTVDEVTPTRLFFDTQDLDTQHLPSYQSPRLPHVLTHISRLGHRVRRFSFLREL